MLPGKYLSKVLIFALARELIELTFHSSSSSPFAFSELIGLLYKISWKDFKAANETSLDLLRAEHSMNSNSSEQARGKSPID